MTFEDLENKLHNQNNSSIQNDVIKIILSAENDWPIESLTIEDYLKQLHDFIGNIINIQTIEAKLLTSSITSAWEIESLTQLKEIFQLFNDKRTLEDIFEEFIFNKK